MSPEKVDLHELIRRYCDSQDCEPVELGERLNALIAKFKPNGIFLARCEVFDSRFFGQTVILPYGPNNTFKAPPEHPFSPRGLASDTSVVECVVEFEKNKKDEHQN